MFSFRGVLALSFHIEIDRGKRIVSEIPGNACIGTSPCTRNKNMKGLNDYGLY